MNEKLKKVIRYGLLSNNEAYIQAELYHHCKLRSIEIYLEQHLGSLGRPDAIVIINNEPIIIECKVKHQTINIYGEQIFRYSKTKLPLLILQDQDLVIKALDFLSSKKVKNGIYIYDLLIKKFQKYTLKNRTTENELNFKKHMKIKKFYLESENGH